jgi:hypothetical protein
VGLTLSMLAARIFDEYLLKSIFIFRWDRTVSISAWSFKVKIRDIDIYSLHLSIFFVSCRPCSVLCLSSVGFFESCLFLFRSEHTVNWRCVKITIYYCTFTVNCEILLCWCSGYSLMLFCLEDMYPIRICIGIVYKAIFVNKKLRVLFLWFNVLCCNVQLRQQIETKFHNFDVWD